MLNSLCSRSANLLSNASEANCPEWAEDINFHLKSCFSLERLRNSILKRLDKYPVEKQYQTKSTHRVANTQRIHSRQVVRRCDARISWQLSDWESIVWFQCCNLADSRYALRRMKSEIESVDEYPFVYKLLDYWFWLLPLTFGSFVSLNLKSKESRPNWKWGFWEEFCWGRFSQKGSQRDLILPTIPSSNFEILNSRTKLAVQTCGKFWVSFEIQKSGIFA